MKYLLLLLLILPLVAAEYKQMQVVNLTAFCTDDGTPCLSGACNMTILQPNSTVALNNQPMNASGSLFYYQYQPSAIGTYTYIVACCQALHCEISESSFQVTQAGYSKPDRLTIIIAAGIIALLLVLLSIFMSEPELYPFKISFAVLAVIDTLIIIPSALISDSVVMNLFIWGTRVMNVIALGILCLILWKLGMIVLKHTGWKK